MPTTTRNLPPAFKLTAAAGVMLAASLSTAPASLAGNWTGYVQEGVGVLRSIGSARRGADSASTPAPGYTPPPAPTYTPPTPAPPPVYTPPVVHTQIINSTVSPPPQSYYQPARHFGGYQLQVEQQRQRERERMERIAHPRIRVQPVARVQPIKQGPTPTPNPPVVVNIPKDNTTVAPPPSLDKKPADGGKFDVTWISSSMLRILNNF
jgi:hypothetical protein